MRIYTDIEKVKAKNAVVTIGTFDGVHLGHIGILNKLKAVASQVDGESVVLTFWPHPRMVINPNDKKLFLLNTLDERIELFEKTGIDHLVIYHFTSEFAKYSSQEFIRKILVRHLNVKHLVVGFDHQFGHDREGSLDNLKGSSKNFGFSLEKVDALTLNNLKISSTTIRVLLESGDIQTATKYLGYDYFMTGIVVSGSRIGRSIGFPTANLMIENYKLIPASGVYAVEIIHNNHKYKGMLNIGYKPTIIRENKSKSIEAFIIDFDKEIYNEQIRIVFKKKIREEKKFSSIDALQHQLEVDKRHVLELLRS